MKVLTDKMLKVMITLLLVIMFFAVGANAGTEKVTLDLWFHYEKAITETMLKMVKDYEQLNPNVTINVDTAPHADHEKKLQIAYAGGIGPDLFDISTRVIPQFTRVDGLDAADVTAFGVNDLEELKTLFVPGVLDGYIIDDKLITIPVGVSPYAWAINASHFREVGLDPETDYPKTWDDVIEVSKKLVKYDSSGMMIRQPVAFPFGMASAWYLLGFEPLMWQLDGAILNAEQTEATVNSPAGVKALQLWYDMIYEHKIVSLERAREDYIGEFAKGTLSMFFAGPWSIEAWKTTNPDVMDDVMVIPFPRFSEGKSAAAVTSWGLVVNSNSPPEKRKEAWKFITYVASRAEDWVKECGWLIPTKELLVSETAKSFPFFDTFMDVQEDAHPLLITLHFSQIADSVVRAIERTLLNKVPPQESLDMAKTEIDSILRRR